MNDILCDATRSGMTIEALKFFLTTCFQQRYDTAGVPLMLTNSSCSLRSRYDPPNSIRSQMRIQYELRDRKDYGKYEIEIGEYIR